MLPAKGGVEETSEYFKVVNRDVGREAGVTFTACTDFLRAGKYYDNVLSPETMSPRQFVLFLSLLCGIDFGDRAWGVEQQKHVCKSCGAGRMGGCFH